MTKVTYEFNLEEDSKELKQFQKSDQYYFALEEIYSMVRSELKHGDEEFSDNIENLLERVKDLSWIVHED